jgi:hypothetical protein
LFSLNSSVSINLHKFCYNSDDGWSSVKQETVEEMNNL